MNKADEQRVIQEFLKRQRRRLSQKMRALGRKTTKAKRAASRASLRKARKVLRLKWQDPEFREKMRRAISRGRRKKPV